MGAPRPDMLLPWLFTRSMPACQTEVTQDDIESYKLNELTRGRERNIDASTIVHASHLNQKCSVLVKHGKVQRSMLVA